MKPNLNLTVSEKEKKKIIQFLLVGIHQGHIYPVIEQMKSEKIILFTSINLEKEVKDLVSWIKIKKRICADYVFIDPFEPDAIQVNTRKIILKGNEEMKNDARNIEIVCGLTGGTNLMVISMALAALIKGWRCHYVVKKDINNDDNKSEHNILLIDILMEMNKKYELELISPYFEYSNENINYCKYPMTNRKMS